MKATASGLVLGPAILRLSAYVIDAAIIALLAVVLIEAGVLSFTQGDGLARPKDATSLVVMLLLVATYHMAFVSLRSATPGKMAMNLYVAYPDGSAVRPDTAILRYVVILVESVLTIPLLIDIVLLFVDPKRRTIHDRIAGTMVLAGRPEPPPV